MSNITVGTRGETRIHPTALVDDDAELGEGVIVGPWAILGPGVRVGDGTEIGPRVTIERDTILGEDCRIANGAVLGTDPQDLTRPMEVELEVEVPSVLQPGSDGGLELRAVRSWLFELLYLRGR